MAVMRERTRARQQCCCEQQHSKLHGLDLSMDAVMDRTLAIDPLFRRAHRTCAAGDRSVMWRRLKRACAGARSPTRRARARAATDRRRGFAMQRRSQVPAPHCRARRRCCATSARSRFAGSRCLRCCAGIPRSSHAKSVASCAASRPLRTRAKSVARRGDCVAVPRAHELAVVAAVDAIADQRRAALRECCRRARSSGTRCSGARRARTARRSRRSGRRRCTRVHVPQCALDRRRRRQRQVGVDLAEEEIRARVARQQQRVLAAPAEARLGRERHLEHRRAVGEHAIAERADVVLRCGARAARAARAAPCDSRGPARSARRTRACESASTLARGLARPPASSPCAR